MQFEDFDKKIKEAAEHHHPAYDEKAWGKMEKLLDKHMPTEKDDRRRFAFFLLLFLAVALAGVGIYYLKTNQTKKIDTGLTNTLKNEPIKESTEQTPAAREKTTEEKSNRKIKNPVSDKTISPNNNSEAEANPDAKQKNDLEIKKNDQAVIVATTSKINNKSNNTVYKPITIKEQIAVNSNRKKIAGSQTKKETQLSTNTRAANENIVSDEKDNNVKEPVAGMNVSVPGNSSTNNPDINKPGKNDTDNNIVSDKPASQVSTLQKEAIGTTKTDETKSNTIAQQKPTPKPSKQRKSAFAITFTAMPDLSTVGISKAGKVKLGYGAGISYTLNRFTVRSGFYVGRKVYTAGPDDYHPQKPNWVYNVNLDKVDANCKVYEIPFLLSYNFVQSKKSNWFFSTGLSTYLMKSEAYDYTYTYSGSPTVHWKTTTVNNEYKHFFSILNLSLGYERRLNNRMSLSAEPYFKAPLDGIGYGKIQLNSAGVALTLSIKPFISKK